MDLSNIGGGGVVRQSLRMQRLSCNNSPPVICCKLQRPQKPLDAKEQRQVKMDLDHSSPVGAFSTQLS